jgi:hypothetical protein
MRGWRLEARGWEVPRSASDLAASRLDVMTIETLTQTGLPASSV